MPRADRTDATAVAGRAPGRRRIREPELVLGRYRLIRRLGAGGFGTVWLGWDERLEREVALKLLPRERLVSGRFDREARAAARLNHPAIVVLYEAAVDDQGGYLVSELVRGHTLGRLLQDGCLSDRDVVRLAIALCDALGYAHHQGVVHRDVKPSNILLPDAPSTAAEVAKLTDFGVARLVGGDSLTRTGEVVGTTLYMAPEQAEGREADGSADLYSLALVVYEGLTGVNPVRQVPGAGRIGRLGTHLPAVRRHRRDLPRELACAIDLALRPRHRERGTLEELREALVTSLPLVDDEPGVVAALRTGQLRRPASHERPAPWPASDRTPCPAPDAASSPPAQSGHTLARLLAAGGAAAATAWFASGVLSPSPVLPALVVLGAGLAVALLPRAAWLVLALAGAGLLVEQDSPGGAIVLLVAVVPVVILLRRSPTRWSPPAAVPALALLGLGGLWPALAGRASTAWERAVLGAAGWLWLVVGGFLTGQGAYLRLPSGTPAPRLWMPSLYDTVHQVLDPLLHSGILAPALIWAVGALVLPWIAAAPARRREPGAWLVRLGLVAGWAGAVALLTNGVLAVAAPGTRIPTAQAILGALACGAMGGLRCPATGRRALRHARPPVRDSRSMETR
jgi:serine/threonine protein kinase